MEEMPKTTLTQRRNQITGGLNTLPRQSAPSISSGAKKLTKEMLDHSPDEEDHQGSAVRIFVWILVMLVIGVGVALLLSNVLSSESNDNSTDTVADTGPLDQDDDLEPVSFPASNEVDEEQNTDKQETDTETDNEANEGETDTGEVDNGDSVTLEQLFEYDNKDRILNASSENSEISFTYFKFFETGTEFNYVLGKITGNNGVDPELKLYYEGNDLVLEIRNVKFDGVTGNGNSTQRNLNVLGISQTQTSNSNGVSKYRFVMQEKYNSRIEIDKENNQMILQIDNRK